MNNQSNNFLGWLLGFGIALLLCAIAIVVSSYRGEQGSNAILFFDSLSYFLLFVTAGGVFCSAKLRRTGDRLEQDRVLRHDGVARLTHWTSAFGCVLLLVTGVVLGFLWFPRLVTSAGATALMFNLHFIGALYFLFGCSLWACNQLVDTHRLRSHLPDESLWIEVKKSFLHYTHMLGLTPNHIPAPKYHHSGRLAGLVIIVTSLVVIVSGFGKLVARGVDLDPVIIEMISFGHGWAALVMLLLIPVHALLGGVAPWAWNTLVGMVTGYVSRDYARQHHSLWFRELEQKQQQQESQQ
ncbi:formate dehydrogenase subunit gamma [Ferrimonas sediminum]|uniref:Formate dehydrogenase subunit gamma n=1 Tax=Ferrimonas sediminum TaxID=718193 RepID=A0A1G8NJZ8_9GAMM|nr:cytochrome b/b6 domain-containing protein [Ferrimonas sediminum]SDI80523.1 formate dehydrogenase subunit gamma [Ferrimonas sediminum]